MRVKRVMYNADFGFYGWSPDIIHYEGRPLTAKLIQRYVKLVAGTGADTFIMNPNTQRAWFPSKAIPTILDGYVRGDRNFADKMPWGVEGWEHDPLGGCVDFLNRFLDLKEAGIDWLAETAKECRTNGLTPWASVRMNDMHGAGRPKGHYMNAPLYDDPEFRLSGIDFNPANGNKRYFAGMNYEKKEVRDYYFALIRELVEDYDFDGLQLDFNRNPLVCNPPASQETIDMMTAWIGEICALTQRQAKRNGRPYTLGMRVPGNVEMLREIGVDVYHIAELGLIDYICPADFVFSSFSMPLGDIMKRINGACEVYGVNEWGVNRIEMQGSNGKPELRGLYAVPEYSRACAVTQLVQGCDGLELYNPFCGDGGSMEFINRKYQNMQNIGDLEFLRGKPKCYSFPTATGICWVPPFENTEQLPCSIDPSARRRFRLPMCSEPKESGLKLFVTVAVEKRETEPEIGLSFNSSWPDFYGKPVTELHLPSGEINIYPETMTVHIFEIDISRIKEGWNAIDIYNGSGKNGSFRIVNIDVAVIGGQPV